MCKIWRIASIGYYVVKNVFYFVLLSVCTTFSSFCKQKLGCVSEMLK